MCYGSNITRGEKTAAVKIAHGTPARFRNNFGDSRAKIITPGRRFVVSSPRLLLKEPDIKGTEAHESFLTPEERLLCWKTRDPLKA